MNFLRQLSFKPPPAPDAYGCVSTLEENPTSTLGAHTYQDSVNVGPSSTQGPAVVIRDKLRGSPFLEDEQLSQPPASPSKIKAAGSNAVSSLAANTSNLFGAIASLTTKKEDPSTSGKNIEPEASHGKLMGEININWDYVAPVEKRPSEEGSTDVDRLKQTQKVLEEEKKGQFATGIHAAVISQDSNALKQLHHRGADIEAKNQRGQCVLHVASCYGYPALVKAILQLKANVDCRDEDGQTPLHMAASGRMDGDLEGRLACMALLLAAKANMELPDKVGKAPLHVAAQTGNLDTLIKLLDAGAHRAPRDRNGMRPVDLASMAGFSYIVDHLTAIDTAAQIGKLQQYSKYL